LEGEGANKERDKARAAYERVDDADISLFIVLEIVKQN
jgi:hypothetical protein